MSIAKKSPFIYAKICGDILNEIKANPEKYSKNIPMATCKKLVFYGVKMINQLGDLKSEEPESHFQNICSINDIISTLTPREFMTIFPIDKKYNGKRWQEKDYFSTMKYINTIGIDNLIGENVMHFLWEYSNWDICLFEVQTMSFMDQMRREQGLPGMMEEFLENQGVQSYTLHTDKDGKEFLLGKDGKTLKVNPPRPKHLKVIKGCDAQ